MAWSLRFVYTGAVYHIMARGDGGKKLFLTEADHLLFLDWQDAACKSHGWRIHAWVLMGNHFHLLLETPEANLESSVDLSVTTENPLDNFLKPALPSPCDVHA